MRAPKDDNHQTGLIAKDTVSGDAFPVEGRSGSGAVFVELTGSKLVPEAYDYIEVTEGSTTDVFVYKTGGTGGSTVATVTVTYTTTDKDVLDNIART